MNRLVELERQANEIEAQQDMVKAQIIQHARAHGIRSISGLHKDAVIKSRTDVIIPSRHSDSRQYKTFLGMLRNSIHWPRFVDFCPAKFRQFINTKEGKTLRESLETMVHEETQEYVALQIRQKPAVEGLKEGGK